MNELVFNAQNYKSYFAWIKFRSLNPEQREDLIRCSVEQISKEKGLQQVNVGFEKADAHSRGYCYQRFEGEKFASHEIRLNDDILTESDNFYSPYQIYNTINHELEHASQFEHASNMAISNSDSATLEQRLNDQHYYSSAGDKIVFNPGERPHRELRFDKQTDFQMYRAQACEADARSAGYSAVQGLKQEGQSDTYLDAYLRTEKAREINNNRVMMSRLGMHSREEMAKEELSHITLEKVNEQDRQKVLEYARQKDFETAKEVLSADSNGTATEERIRQQFDNNQTYSNFYQSQRYNDNKVKGFDHELYSYAQYKWEDDETAREEYFARSSLGEDDESADAQFFENYSSEIELAEEPDESFLAKQSQISDSSKITYAQKIKGAAVGIFGAAAMKNALDAHDHGYMTTAGYNASLGMKGMGKGMEALSHVPSGASVAGTAADTAGHMYDAYRANEHPEEVINFSPSPVPQEQIDSHTLTVDINKGIINNS